MIERKKHMKIAISAESTIDLPKNMLEEFDIRIVPFTLILGIGWRSPCPRAL